MANCVNRCFDGNQLSIEVDLSRLSLARAEQSLYEFRSTRTHQSGKTDNLTPTNPESDIGEFSTCGQPLDAQHLFTIDPRVFVGKLFADLTPNHVSH